MQIEHGNRPAFPINLPGHGDNGASGITVREHIAIQAMAALISYGEDVPKCGLEYRDWLSERSFEYADSMLAKIENQDSIQKKAYKYECLIRDLIGTMRGIKQDNTKDDMQQFALCMTRAMRIIDAPLSWEYENGEFVCH